MGAISRRSKEGWRSRRKGLEVRPIQTKEDDLRNKGGVSEGSPRNRPDNASEAGLRYGDQKICGIKNLLSKDAPAEKIY